MAATKGTIQVFPGFRNCSMDSSVCADWPTASFGVESIGPSQDLAKSENIGTPCAQTLGPAAGATGYSVFGVLVHQFALPDGAERLFLRTILALRMFESSGMKACR